jgi:hypothetical protein
MVDSPYWLGFSADSWGTSWGANVEVEENPAKFSVGGMGVHAGESFLKPQQPGRRRRLSGRDDARRRAIRKSDEETFLLLI